MSGLLNAIDSATQVVYQSASVYNPITAISEGVNKVFVGVCAMAMDWSYQAESQQAAQEKNRVWQSGDDFITVAGKAEISDGMMQLLPTIIGTIGVTVAFYFLCNRQVEQINRPGQDRV
jgi:hypothetical protein